MKYDGKGRRYIRPEWSGFENAFFGRSKAFGWSKLGRSKLGQSKLGQSKLGRSK
jgi:hypothetical protein